MNDKYPLYWEFVREEAAKIGSDGCSVVSELFHDACLQHDLAYWYAKDPKSAYAEMLLGIEDCWVEADPITRKEADAQFKQAIRAKSAFGKWSFIALVRWAGVRLGGRWAWRKHRRREQVALSKQDSESQHASN
mgnify:FL=1